MSRGSERGPPIYLQKAVFELMPDGTVEGDMTKESSSSVCYYSTPCKARDSRSVFMDYKHAVVKVEDGTVTLLCNNCGIVIAKGRKHENRKHY